MTQIRIKWYSYLTAILITSISTGCISTSKLWLSHKSNNNESCQAGTCNRDDGHDHDDDDDDSCSSCGKEYKHGSNSCDSCGFKHRWFGGGGVSGGGWAGGLLHRRTLSIPDVYPLGSTTRAHWHRMETNAEATDFILHRHDFVGSTAELTPDGKDRVLEIAGRMRSAPFPVLVERTENNSDPELDQHRRAIIAQVLADLGNPDAQQRTIVSPAYAKAQNSRESETDYYRFTFSRGNNGGGNNGGGNNGGGGFGGGGGGFGGGGGGGFGGGF